jgi:hypothetical protein
MTGPGASSIAYPRFGGESEWHAVIWYHFGQRTSPFELLGKENPVLADSWHRDFRAINLLPLFVFHQGSLKALGKIEAWFKQKRREGDVLRRTAMGIASNLRRCSNDSVIYTLSDTIGSKVYGQEYVLGTTDAGRVEPITLVKVDRDIALRMLEQLPKKDCTETLQRR